MPSDPEVHHSPLWLESRLWPEYRALVRDPIFRGEGVERSDGKPVFLIPGFMAGDYTLFTLRDWLTKMGYRPELAGINFNFWHSEKTMRGLAQRLVDQQRRAGRRVAILGHSRGGMLGKVLADRYPKLVEQVIALGAPLNDPEDVHPLTMAWIRAAHLANRVRFGSSAQAEQPFLDELAAPATVPVTSIYTRSDGVINWRACLRGDVTPVEIEGSHAGLAVNRNVYRLLAHLLAPKRA